jgi:hypothetical protein
MLLRRKAGGRRGRAALFAGCCCALAVGVLVASPAPSKETRAQRTAPSAPSAALELGLTLDVPESRFGGAAARTFTPQAALLPPVTTSHRVYAKPPLPALPAAGGKYRDPAFGTEVMRATDERDGAAPGLGTYYSHWPTFNSDSTLLLIRKGTNGAAVLKRFDPARFELVGRAEQLPQSLPGEGGPNWESSIWSHDDPRIIYTFASYYTGGMKLYAYDVVTRRFTLLKDFGALGGKRDYLYQMSVSADDDVFAFSQRTAGVDQPTYYIVWRRSADKVLAHEATGGRVNEVRVDKSGRYLAVPFNGVQPDGSRGAFRDLSDGRVETLRWNAQDAPSGHGDLGAGFNAGFDPWADGINRRELSDVHRPRVVFQFKTEAGQLDWTEDFHGSLLADNEDWMTVGTYDQAEVTLPEYGVFEDEIFQVALDGSGRVRRVCHTRSRVLNRNDADNYWAMPKPTVTRDGRYIAYTSNWEGSGRTDLFIAKIDPAPALPRNAQPAAAPPRRQTRAPNRRPR